MSYNELRKGRYSAPGQEYLITTVTSGRKHLFIDINSAKPIIRALEDTAVTDECCWLAWVLMPDHFHGLVALGDGSSLATVMHQFKGRSARSWNRRFGRSGALWQPNFHDRALRIDEDRRSVSRYLIGNPVRAGLVERVGDYPFWDAIWLDPLSG
ncbi:MAG: transposase [Gammaproteobacteria bacterium]|jgi:REP element-mobilizing transposase RayT|nr:transposase [Gammaproteobacteria bacterium]